MPDSNEMKRKPGRPRKTGGATPPAERTRQYRERMKEGGDQIPAETVAETKAIVSGAPSAAVAHLRRVCNGLANGITGTGSWRVTKEVALAGRHVEAIKDYAELKGMSFAAAFNLITDAALNRFYGVYLTSPDIQRQRKEKGMSRPESEIDKLIQLEHHWLTGNAVGNEEK